MRTFSFIKGLPVIVVHNGEKLGEVIDLCLSGEGEVKGLLVKKSSLIKKRCSLNVEDILTVDSSGVLVESSKVLKPLAEPPEYTFEHQDALSGKMMYSNDGEELGLLLDVYFLEDLGTIVGYELTDGFFADITDGKRFIHAVDPPAIIKDAIIVNVMKDVNEVSINDDMPELSK
ncbi:PRC-barrel domain-containing protein [Bacillus sp. B15-48]|uniref:PRC-barrel domain-containing protein n=1 Tax=Bacillus sp. B15-48 TaxID=1548601 RepID=UPI00193F0A4A|nr:PRC-barrel domain-containing protein [Bacillus sp. B15-48]MBM4762390.1 photosystem reaction center subunit H [Bacillus sp. B15-48]